VFLSDGVLNPGDSVVARLRFADDQGSRSNRYSLKLLSGQGNP
jgi:hypothetical protein